MWIYASTTPYRYFEKGEEGENMAAQGRLEDKFYALNFSAKPFHSICKKTWPFQKVANTHLHSS
jgi:hypothetical protein